MANSLLLYIQRADPQWLDHQLPPSLERFIPRPPDIDWTKEDALFAKEVKIAIAEINAAEPPTKISIKAIAKRVGQLNRLRKHLDKMPQTSSLIETHLETTDDYLVRRIKWVEESFRKEMTAPTKTALAKRAQIRRYLAAGNEVIRQATEDALQRLRSGVQKSQQ
jgi:hypothetical protein